MTTEPKGPGRDLMPPLIAVAAVFLYWWRATLLGLTPGIRDPGHLNEVYFSLFPAWNLLSSMLREGVLPLWSPHAHGGMLLMADQHYTIAYPPIWVNLLFDTAASFTIVTVLHFAVAAVSLYFLVRALGGAPVAAFFAAGVYAFSYPVVHGFLLYGAFWAWHLSPLILLLALRHMERGGRTALFFLAVLWGMQMCTFIQSSYNLSILFAAFVLWRAVVAACGGAGWRAAGRRLAGIAAAVTLGTCLAAVHIIPLLEFSTLWQYQQFTFEKAVPMSVPHGKALECLLSAMRYWPGWWVHIAYVGATGVVFSLYGAALDWRNGAARFFAVAFVVTYLLALGSYTPLYRLFFTYVPGADFFHHPARFIWSVPLCLAPLAGFGADRLLRVAAGGRRRADAAFFLSLLILVAALTAGKALGAGWAGAVPLSAAAVRNVAPFYLAALAIAAIVLMGGRRAGLAVALLFGLAFAESYRNAAHIVFFDAREKYAMPAAAAFLREKAGLGRFFTYNKHVHDYSPRFMDADAVPLLYPELSNLYRLYDIQCRGPLHVRRYDSLMKAANRGYEIVIDTVAYNPRIRDLTSPVIDLFGVRYVVSKGELDVPLRILHDAFEERTAGPGEPYSIRPGGTVTTDEIVMQSYLEGAADAPQGAVVALAEFFLGKAKVAEHPVIAGIHTAEVFDLNDPRRASFVRHRRAEEWESWDEWTEGGAPLTGTCYRTALDLGAPVTFDQMDLRYLHDRGELTFRRVYCAPPDRARVLEEIKERYEPVFRDEAHGVIVYEYRRAMPRAFLARDVLQVRDGAEALDRLLDGSVDPSARIIIEEPPPAWYPRGGGDEGPPGDAEITMYSPNRIEFRTSSDGPRFLFLSDVSYPGWEAEVDGAPAPLYLAHYAFRAVPVPAGDHTVVMRFRPRSVAVGGAVSLAAALAIAGLGISALVRRRARP
ncbi:MAG: YfhO family protein [bacterium]|nr:YfhO family protein [bacterium]